MRKLSLVFLVALCAMPALARDPNNPTWWDKYQYLIKNGEMAGGAATTSVASGANVDVSNECGPQSETYITINTANAKQLAGGSNEIFRDPMRGYWSADGGKTWGGVDLPLPPPIGTNGIRGTSMGVARSTDGGRTYGSVNFFSFSGGSDHFNDKPMITTDTNAGSP